MPKENNVLFSDVGAARSLSQKLTGRKPNGGAKPEPTSYVSFRNGVGSPRTVHPPDVKPEVLPPVPPPPPEEDTSTWGEGAWQQRLEWVLVTAKAKCAVVLDRQGLVVATRGDITPDKAQAWGGRLLLMLDQAAHIEDRSLRSVCIELDDEWLTGVTGTGPDHPEVAIAVLADRPVAATIRSAFSTLFCG